MELHIYIYIRKIFSYLGKSNLRKNPYIITFYHSYFRDKKCLLLRFVDFFRFTDFFRLAALNGFALPFIIHNT